MAVTRARAVRTLPSRRTERMSSPSVSRGSTVGLRYLCSGRAQVSGSHIEVAWLPPAGWLCDECQKPACPHIRAAISALTATHSAHDEERRAHSEREGRTRPGHTHRGQQRQRTGSAKARPEAAGEQPDSPKTAKDATAGDERHSRREQHDEREQRNDGDADDSSTTTPGIISRSPRTNGPGVRPGPPRPRSDAGERSAPADGFSTSRPIDIL